jgi:hypothetical protein
MTNNKRAWVYLQGENTRYGSEVSTNIGPIERQTENKEHLSGRFVQLTYIFSAFYGTRRFITVFTRALNWSLS